MIQFLLYSNGMVVLAIALFTALNMRLLNAFHPQLIIFNIFCTLFAYNFPRYVFVKNYSSSSTGKRAQWYQTHKSYLKNIATVSFFGGLLYVGQLNLAQCIFLCFIAAISILYVAPSTQVQSLRRVPYLKPFIIALSWVSLTLVVPYLMDLNPTMLKSTALWTLFAGQFIIVFITAVLFDLRDVEEDQREGIKTIANQWTLRQVKFLCYLLIYLRLLCCIDHDRVAAELVFSFILTFLVYLTHSKRSDYFFLCIIDGSLVVYPMIILVL
ncbi:MAG TPA: UbiA family prenyltransferase [Cytophagales bacterium]|nr:UbiA family prenyltransferase [Cytophagales bacterium]